MVTDDIFARIHGNDTTGAGRALVETPALAAARHTGLGSTPLHFAAHRGQLDVIDALLAAGAEVEARETASDTTALHWAAKGGRAAVVEALLAAGADIGVRDAWYRLTPPGWSTLVDWAPHLRADRPAVIGVLLAADASTGGRRLGFAAGGFPGVVRALVDAGADQQARDATFGATPLGWAEASGHEEIVVLLRDNTVR